MRTRHTALKAKSDCQGPDFPRADEYLETFDDVVFGVSTKAIPKYISSTDPAARWTGADGAAAYFADSTNYLVDLDIVVISDG